MNRFCTVWGALALAAVLSTRAFAAPDAPRKAVGGLTKSGKVTLTAKGSVASQGAISYTGAHMVTDNGTTLDADELKALFAKTGTGTGLDKAIATGNVKATVNQPEVGRKYLVYADKAVFDPKLNEIDLTGNVRILINSAYTEGPLVQTGNSAVIKLGPAPNYPVITMNDVQTTFTLNQ
jgi:lipopolysaccharide export system protein LptA